MTKDNCPDGSALSEGLGARCRSVIMLARKE